MIKMITANVPLECRYICYILRKNSKETKFHRHNVLETINLSIGSSFERLISFRIRHFLSLGYVLSLEKTARFYRYSNQDPTLVCISSRTLYHCAKLPTERWKNLFLPYILVTITTNIHRIRHSKLVTEVIRFFSRYIIRLDLAWNLRRQ